MTRVFALLFIVAYAVAGWLVIKHFVADETVRIAACFLFGGLSGRFVLGPMFDKVFDL